MFNSTWSFAAGSGAGSSASTTTRGFSPAEISAKAFRTGIKHRDRALSLEAKADKASSEKARDKALGKAQKAFQKAVNKQGEALKLDPQNYKAANELGYALRKTGDFRKAIGAYNYALDINPNFHAATEYRAEAYLALGMYEKTQRAYMKLFRDDRELASELMAAIDKWRLNIADASTDSELRFLKWVDERKRLAEITNNLSSNNTRSW
jgi:tetratricopeptide (TPR) repeat protein